MRFHRRHQVPYKKRKTHTHGRPNRTPEPGRDTEYFSTSRPTPGSVALRERRVHDGLLAPGIREVAHARARRLAVRSLVSNGGDAR